MSCITQLQYGPDPHSRIVFSRQGVRKTRVAALKSRFDREKMMQCSFKPKINPTPPRRKKGAAAATNPSVRQKKIEESANQ